MVKDAPLLSYHDSESAISFQYPSGENGYTLAEIKTLSDNPEFQKSLALVSNKIEDDVIASDTPREGPPAMSVTIFKNKKNTELAAWAEANKTYSNFGMKTDVPAELEISGAKAIHYTSDGLYQSDNVIIEKGGYVYVITGAYIDELSQLHKDFLGLIGSIEFATSTKASS